MEERKMNKTYFKYAKFGESWILPVWTDSMMYKDPAGCFGWDKDIHFVSEVSEQEYEASFFPKKEPVQLELFTC